MILILKILYFYSQMTVREMLSIMETLGHRVHQLFTNLRRKFIEEQITRHKKKGTWNWPELHLYCGVCDLKTGLYIKSVCSVLIYIVILVINVLLLYYLVSTGATLATMEISDVEEYLGVNFTEVKVEKIKKIYTAMISYMVFSIMFKFVYITAMFLLVYGMYNKKQKLMKSVLFVNAINWILDLFIAFFGALILQIMSRTMAVLCVLFEGYNLMAVNSEYKKLRGKSKLLINLRNVDVNTEAISASLSPDLRQPEGSEQCISDNDKHCETCTCNDVGNQNCTVVSTTNTFRYHIGPSLNQPSVSEPEIEKPLNIKDVETIFNQDLLVPSENAVLEVVPCVNGTVFSQIAERPRTLHLPCYSKDKIDIADIPTIYDENQLHVAGSPVVEHNPEYQRPSL